MPLDLLYRELIIDHFKNPRNFGELAGEPVSIRHNNPACGDVISLVVKFSPGNIIHDIRFDGYGCALCLASASIMTELVKGKADSAALQTLESFEHMLGQAENSRECTDELTALASVRNYPARIACAKLPWQALAISLGKKSD